MNAKHDRSWDKEDQNVLLPRLEPYKAFPQKSGTTKVCDRSRHRAARIVRTLVPERAEAPVGEFRIYPISFGPDIPLTTVLSSVLNAELLFRGSQIKNGGNLAVPHRAVTPEFTANVETDLKGARTQSSAQRTASARMLWSSLLEDGEEPTAAQLAKALANLQIPELRDRLLADMPGLDLPIELLLFGESDTAPDWGRIDNAVGPLGSVRSLCTGRPHMPLTSKNTP